jgi:uncharacterized glyoxalase superfamily protein PhnB
MAPDARESYRTVTPYLVVSDADAELKFLADAFDAKIAGCDRNDEGMVMHAEVRIGDSLVMIGQAAREWPPLTAALYLWVPDVDAVYRRALAAGAASQFPPEDKPYGHRNAGIVDANNITWWIGAPVRKA